MYRPLLPAAAIPTRETRPPQPPPPRVPRRRPTKNTTVACQRCRKYKTKCDGQSPCSACVKKGFRDCLYDAANSRHELRQRADALAREVATLKAKGRAAPPAQGEHAAARLSDSPHSSFSSSSDNSRNLISPDPDLCVDSYQDYEAELQDGQVFASRVSEAPSIDPNLGDLATILSNLALTTTDAATRDGLMSLLQNCQNVQPAHVAVSLEGHSRAGGRLSSFSEPAVAPRDMNNGNSNQEIGAYDAAVPFLPMDGTDYPAAPASVLPYRTPVASSMPFPETAGYMRGFAPGRYSTYQRGARHETEGRNGYGNSAQSGRTDHVPSQTQTRLVSKRQPSLHGFMPFSSSIKANHYPRDVQDTQLANLGASQCAAETCWLPVECIPDGPAKWASNTFTGVRNRARWAIANGACAESLTRSTSLQNIVSDYKQRLVDPDYKRDPEQEMNVSDWAQAFVTWFPHLGLADRVACWAVLYKVLRWQACPTPATYADVPIWCRPSKAEKFVPHLPILICLAWPKLRSYLAEEAASLDWTNAVMGSISVSWPHLQHTIFKEATNGDLIMSDAFDAWVSNLDNWSVHGSTASMVPCIDGRANVRA